MTQENDSLTDEELERADGELLPDREVMSVVTPGFDDPLPPSAVLDPLQGGEEL
jgi:hypothetical protein